MRVDLKKMLVFWLNTSSLSRSFDRSTSIGPTCRHETEKFDGSSFKPNGWPHPPFRACEIWHATPGTCGSSNTLTQTLSLGESALKVVLTQPRSSARAEWTVKAAVAATTRSHFIFQLSRIAAGRPETRRHRSNLGRARRPA